VTDTAGNPFEFYDKKLAASDLRKYKETGPRPWTRALVDALKAEGLEGATVLNIGGGVGVVQLELLAAGASHATMVEASPAYLQAAREESDRRGLRNSVSYETGDFVDLADTIPSADIVVLERVLNVYTDWQRLAAVSAEHAERLYAVVIPRDGLIVKFVIALINLRLRLRGQHVRARIVPIEALEAIVREHGLSPSSKQAVGPAWLVAVYRRREDAAIAPAP
jgi:tRNA A58 N-methylase Trm61